MTDRDAELKDAVERIYAQAAELYAAGMPREAAAKQAEGTEIWSKTSDFQAALSRSALRRARK